MLSSLEFSAILSTSNWVKTKNHC